MLLLASPRTAAQAPPTTQNSTTGPLSAPPPAATTPVETTTAPVVAETTTATKPTPSTPATAPKTAPKAAAKPVTPAPKKTTQTPATSTSTSTSTKTQAAPKPATPSRASVSRALAAERKRVADKKREERDSKAMFTRDANGNIVPEVRAAAAIIYDPKSGDILWDQNSHDQRSIASLTKVMTAVAFISDSPDLTQKVTITRADTISASTTYLRTGDRVSYDDLLHLALIASDNAAARALARTSEGGTAAFVARMNEWASPAKLNLTDTKYVDPSGLDADNVSSAFDLSRLIAYASSNDQLGPIMRTPDYVISTATREFSIHSTNRLLATAVGAEVLGAKTGFISKAGYCLATLLQMPQGSRVSVVVLGATTSTTRFNEAVNLFNWIRGKSQGIDTGDLIDLLLPSPRHHR
jgi:D-alanyl-D-alanine endopeptidase (penicillin-binding protein 7)